MLYALVGQKDEQTERQKDKKTKSWWIGHRRHPDDLQWTKIENGEWGREGSNINIFWPTKFNDLWSKQICRPKIIIGHRCYIHLRWSCLIAWVNSGQQPADERRRQAGGDRLLCHLVRPLQDDRAPPGGDGQDHGRRCLPQGWRRRVRRHFGGVQGRIQVLPSILAIFYKVTAMPTFIFLKNKEKVTRYQNIKKTFLSSTSKYQITLLSSSS